MTKFLLSVHTAAGEVRAPMTDAQLRESVARIGALERAMQAEGAWVFSGRLDEPDATAVVRVADGQTLTTDGPFAETKEHLGGFYVIEAADRDTALAWAAKVTAAVGAPIEVRPFVGFATEPMA